MTVGVEDVVPIDKLSRVPPRTPRSPKPSRCVMDEDEGLSLLHAAWRLAIDLEKETP
jgi:hypothetical protein